jgi:hypothetical protein
MSPIKDENLSNPASPFKAAEFSLSPLKRVSDHDSSGRNLDKLQTHDKNLATSLPFMNSLLIEWLEYDLNEVYPDQSLAYSLFFMVQDRVKNTSHLLTFFLKINGFPFAVLQTPLEIVLVKTHATSKDLRPLIEALTLLVSRNKLTSQTHL